MGWGQEAETEGPCGLTHPLNAAVLTEAEMPARYTWGGKTRVTSD